MEGSADIRQGLEEVNLELQHVERQIERLLQKQQRLQERKQQLEMQAGRLQELSNRTGSVGIDWEKSDYPWSSKLHKLKETVFGIKKFRPLQEKTMNASLSGRDVLLLMPTGGGKSLCYQLPALVSKGFTLIVSPLVSLMEDQTMALEELGVNATVLNASTPPEVVREVHNTMIDPQSDLKLLYVTPEKIAKSKRFMARLERAYKAKLLSRIAIDEVHCCSQWGHDFRPDYKILGLLKRQFPDTPILGLTATATLDVLDDVKSILGLQGCQVFRAGFNRPNLFYEVRPKPTNQPEFVEELTKLITGEFKDQSGIIYCFSRKDTETLADNLKKNGIKAHPYHAMLDAQFRSYVHKSWKENSIQVVVATVAFGMGIDKPDVRFVIYHSISKSMENYYQESGRAGRDDKPAKCIVYYGLADVFRQSTMVVTEQTGQEKLYNMLAYCVTPNQCRRSLIGRHFGERWEHNANCNKMCDACRSGAHATEKDMVSHLLRIYKVLEDASRKDSRITALKLQEELMKKKGVAPQEKDLAKKMQASEYAYFIAHLLLEGYLKEDFHFTPYSTISYIVPGPKARLVHANPQQPVKVPFRSSETETSKTSKVVCDGGTGHGKVKKGGVSTVTSDPREGVHRSKEGERERGKQQMKRMESHGKAKKRKLDEDVEIIDLCSDDDDADEDSDDDFVKGKASERFAKSAKLVGAQTAGQSSKSGERIASHGASKAKMEQTLKVAGGTEAKSGANSRNKVVEDMSDSEKGLHSPTDVDFQKKCSIRNTSGLGEPQQAGKFVFKPETSTSLAKVNIKGADSANQGQLKQSHDLAMASDQTSSYSTPVGTLSGKQRKTKSVLDEGPSRPTDSDPHKGPKMSWSGDQVTPTRRTSTTPSSVISPGSDFELDLHTVYTEQLRYLGSDGESFNRENSSFTMSTSFSGSEDGVGRARRDSDGRGRRRKGVMKRVDSMDNYDEDDDEDVPKGGDEFALLKQVYSKQMERLNDSS